MHSTRFPRGAAAFAAVAGLASAALAQEQVMIARSTDPALPYTVIYPQLLQPVDDESSETLATLRHPDTLLQCDIFSIPGGREGWTAEAAVENLDVAGIEASWTPDFPGFKITDRRVAAFQSGPAVLYEGESESSPWGVPVRIVHAEAVADGRTYAVECLTERGIAELVRPIVDFVVVNFSTRSDGECCIDPTEDRG